jgi:hypothetical protein
MKKITLLALACFAMSGTGLFSQNVAINATGAAPNSTAMLDISSTTMGFLAPRMTTAQRTAIAGPAQGLTVYDVTTNSYWVYNGSSWQQIFTGALGWALAGNTLIGTEFIGSINAQPLIFRTNNTERMRILSNGNIGVAVTNPALPFQAAGTAAATGYFENTNNGNDGLYGVNTAAAGTGGGAGVVGISNQSGSGSAGIWGQNNHTNGTGIVGTGNNQAGSTLVAGSGGAFTGFSTAVYARTNNAGISQCEYTDNFGSIVRVNYWNGAQQYKINGAGTVSCVVPDTAGNLITMHCAETPEFYYQDYGQGQLVNGRAHIELDPNFAINVTVNENHPMRVFIQLEDNEYCMGVIVKNKSGTGFDVVELGGGTSNTPFQWSVVCNAADLQMPNGRVSKFADLRFEPAGPAGEATSKSRTSPVQQPNGSTQPQTTPGSGTTPQPAPGRTQTSGAAPAQSAAQPQQ